MALAQMPMARLLLWGAHTLFFALAKGGDGFLEPVWFQRVPAGEHIFTDFDHEKAVEDALGALGC